MKRQMGIVGLMAGASAILVGLLLDYGAYYSLIAAAFDVWASSFAVWVILVSERRKAALSHDLKRDREGL